MMRKVSVITGTRAEYGLLYWIIKRIHEDPALTLQLVVTGSHLSPEFGLTIRDIEKDGFPITEKIEMLLSADTETAISSSMGIGIMGFSKVYEHLNPDLLVVLGDRFEILSAVAAAVPFRIPVAHIHGGETTEGAMDELFRHAITKMSHLHFPTAPDYAKRIIQMGESPDRVFCFGAPGLDNIHELQLLSRNELFEALRLPYNKKIGIVTYHPVTLEKGTAQIQMSNLLNAIQKFDDVYWIFTLPNADTGGRVIITLINTFVERFPTQGMAHASLGQLRYTSLLKHAAIMVGNSSSGIIEAPSFSLPVVNIGDRQKGRIRAKNVIDVPTGDQDEIVSAIRQAISGKFLQSLKDIRNPYGEGNTSANIVKIIKSISLRQLTKKRFHDIPKQN